MEENCRKSEDKEEINKMELLLQNYEKKTFELEEREMEVRYRLQMLENTMPALMMWNMWRMMMSSQGGGHSAPPQYQHLGNVKSESQQLREVELMAKLRALEVKLTNEKTLLDESRKAESELKEKIDQLEAVFNNSEDGVLERGPSEEIEILEKLSTLARERLQKDKMIKDLQVREKLYHETLQQADNLFSEMENECEIQKQINQSGQSPLQHQYPSVHQSKDKEFSHINESSVFTSDVPVSLKERLFSLEEETRIIEKQLEQIEKDKINLDSEEIQLKTLLSTHQELIEKLKMALNGSKLAMEKETSTYIPLSNAQIKTHLAEKQRELEVAMRELKGDLIKRKGGEELLITDDRDEPKNILDKSAIDNFFRSDLIPEDRFNRKWGISDVSDLHTRSARELRAVIAEIEQQPKFKAWQKMGYFSEAQNIIKHLDTLQPVIK